MRRRFAGVCLFTVLLTGHAATAAPVPQRLAAMSATAPLPARVSACTGLTEGLVVRSARAIKEGRGADRRRFWRNHYRVLQVLDGGRFLGQPLFRRDDTSGETDRSRFAPQPDEIARTPPGALLCEAFVID